MSLEELEKKLYGLDRKDDADNRAPMQQEQEQKESPVQTTWEKEAELTAAEKESRGLSGGVKTAIVLGCVALLAVAGAAYYYISEYYKTKDLAYDANTVERVLIARPFDVVIHVENKSQSILREGKVIVRLPDGVIEVGNESEKQTIEDEVGDLNAGEAVEKTYTLVVVRDAQTTKKLETTFSYLPQNINTRFEREKTLDVAVEDPAITLDFTTPQKVFSTENFDMSLRYRNIADIDFKNTKLKIVAPKGFVYKDASVKPEADNASWVIANLAPQEENTIAVKGSLEGTGQASFEIRGQIVMMLNGKEYVINEKVANLGIAASPLSLDITANNNPDYIAKPGDQLTYVLHYKNNTDVGLNDAIIKATIRGEMVELGSVRTNGSFDSVANTLTWTAASNPELRVINPGAEGTVTFTINTKTAYPIKRMFDKNFTVKVTGEINSPTVPYNVASDRTVGFASSEIKMRGDMTIESGAVAVKGSAGLQVNKPARYTIIWTLKNYATDMTGIKIVGGLEPGVKWLGIVKSNSGTDPAYNDRTGEIVWAMDKIIATKGVIGAPTELTFQVEVTPNVVQRGTSIGLTKDVVMTATDGFTGESVARQMPGLKTAEIAF